MVDRVALEMRSTRKGTGGSNPSLSANSVCRVRLKHGPSAHRWLPVVDCIGRHNTAFLTLCCFIRPHLSRLLTMRVKVQRR